MRKKISFITVNYNGINDTLELIESLQIITSIIIEIIVVDNASFNKKEIEIIKEKYPAIKCIRSEKNLGFAGGNNIGIDIATGDYFMLINNDTIIKEDHFSDLINLFENDSKIGAISPKIVFTNPKNKIQFATYTPLSKITLRNSLIGFLEDNDGRYSDPKQTPYCHGAAMIFKPEILKKAGKMSEIFFLYYEELDWSKKIRNAGYTLWYNPIQTIYHKESASVGNNSALRNYYISRNRLLYAYRNRVGTQKTLSILYQLLIAIPKSLLLNLIKGKFENIKAIIRGTNNYFTLKNKNK
ncbi:MAG: glycosyltransferase family 2 protein [Bacteroidales bacterium]